MGNCKSGMKCDTCFYYESLKSGLWGCFYILYTKQRRGCDPKNCDKWKPRSKKDAVQLRLHMALGERGML